MLCHNRNNKNKTKKPPPPPPEKKKEEEDDKIKKQQQQPEKLAFYSHNLIFLQCLLRGITGIKQLALIFKAKAEYKLALLLVLVIL